MSRHLLLAAVLCFAGPCLMAVQADAAEKPTRFWNLSSKTITNLQLAPTGTTNFGPNQCLNDKDMEVEHDERLKITEVESGSYDAKVGYEGGHACMARGIKVEVGKVFSLEDKDLVECSK